MEVELENDLEMLEQLKINYNQQLKELNQERKGISLLKDLAMIDYSHDVVAKALEEVESRIRSVKTKWGIKQKELIKQRDELEAEVGNWLEEAKNELLAAVEKFSAEYKAFHNKELDLSNEFYHRSREMGVRNTMPKILPSIDSIAQSAFSAMGIKVPPKMVKPVSVSFDRTPPVEGEKTV